MAASLINLCKNDSVLQAVLIKDYICPKDIVTAISRNPANSPVSAITMDFEKSEITIVFYDYVDGDKTKRQLTAPFDTYIILENNVPVTWVSNLADNYTVIASK